MTLGRTGLVTNKLSLGTYGWGGVGPPEVRVIGDENILSLLRAGFRAGIRFLNTAELIATTFGPRKGFTADQFRAVLSGAYASSKLEQLPPMFVRDPRAVEDICFIMGPRGALEGLRKLQSEGLVAYVGVATATPDRRRIGTLSASPFDGAVHAAVAGAIAGALAMMLIERKQDDG